ncbi:unnamed protein product [Phaeothamnion confervicola]
MVVLQKQVQSVLNKMTREKFDKLAQQMLDIPINSLEMLQKLVELVFEKALDEPSFVDMYADLCVRLNDHSGSWTFVKTLYNEDANQWTWSPEVGVDTEVVGPLPRVEAAMELALNEAADFQPVPRPCDLELVQLRIKDKKVIKVMRPADGSRRDEFFVVFMNEADGREQYKISSDAFGSEADAKQQGAKMTGLRYQLLDKCQKQFEQDNIYESVVAEEKGFNWDNLGSAGEREAKKAEFEDRKLRMKRRAIGNIYFIGELYKKDMLKERVIHFCIQKLLSVEEAAKEVGRDGSRVFKLRQIPDKEVDEEDLEALCKLLTTIGIKLDKPKTAAEMTEYFSLLTRHSNNTKKISSRIRFAIKDLIECRAHKWVPRRKEAKAKTLDEIRREAANEQSAAARGGGQRGGPAVADPRVRDRGDRVGGASGGARGGPQDARFGGSGGGGGGSDRRMGASIGGASVIGGRPMSERLGPRPGDSARPATATMGRLAGAAGTAGGRSGATVPPPSRSVGVPVAGGPSDADKEADPARQEVNVRIEAASAAYDAAGGDGRARLERSAGNIITEFLEIGDAKEAKECMLEERNGVTVGLNATAMAGVLADRIMACKEPDRPKMLALARSLVADGVLDAAAATVGLVPRVGNVGDLAVDCPKAEINLARLLAALCAERAVLFPPLLEAIKNGDDPDMGRKCVGLALQGLLALVGPAGLEAARNDLLTVMQFSLPDLLPDREEGRRFCEEFGLFPIFPRLQS